LPANKRLVQNPRLLQGKDMITSSQILGNKISAAATARLDREFVGQDRSRWLYQVVRKIRLGVIWRIPVGFEDETGFHLGVQPAQKVDCMEWERAGLLADKEHF
jgi:hypothetical protein